MAETCRRNRQEETGNQPASVEQGHWNALAFEKASRLLSQLLFSCEFWSVLRERLELPIGGVY